MKAFAIDKYKDELTKRDVPDPVAGPGEVVVAINAASVNPIDERLRQGSFKAILPYDMPLILGHDLAGEVIATGPGATRFKVGDAVFACAGSDRIGTFAERIAVAESTSRQADQPQHGRSGLPAARLALPLGRCWPSGRG